MVCQTGDPLIEMLAGIIWYENLNCLSNFWSFCMKSLRVGTSKKRTVSRRFLRALSLILLSGERKGIIEISLCWVFISA